MNVMRFASLTAVLFVSSVLIAAADDGPINAKCPVEKGKTVKAKVFSTYEGKKIGFCCGRCKASFEANPKQYLKNIPEWTAAGNDEGAAVGKKAPAFTLKDTDGKDVSLADFKGRIVVLEWINPKGAAFQKLDTAKFAGALKGAKDDVVYLPVTSSDGIAADAVAKYLSDQKLDAKGLMDSDGKVAKAFGAKTTPQCFVIDGDGVLRYSGAIDDDPDGTKGDKATNYVVAAVKAIAGGQKVATETSKPWGDEIALKK